MLEIGLAPSDLYIKTAKDTINVASSADVHYLDIVCSCSYLVWVLRFVVR